jgi:release factor glutamine methyltransferase
MEKEQTVSSILSRWRKTLPPLDVELLLAHALSDANPAIGARGGREYILSHPEYGLGAAEFALVEEYCARRMRGEPVAYITGRKEFFSLSFEVNRSVLIPRPETELLVEEAVARRPSSLLDIGTGSGAVAVAVKRHLRECRVAACDASEEALTVARMNAAGILGMHGIRFLKSDYLDGVPPERFDMLVSNPPYVRRARLASLQREIREYEPRIALDGGEDGLDAYRAILGRAGEFLAAGGAIALETDPEVFEGLLDLASGHGYGPEKIVKDLGGSERMIVLSTGGGDG